MKQFDAVIIGAGPAGGACGRTLSKAGYRVLLVEKEKDFAAKDFSSGGSTLEVLRDFNLPEAVVGAYCHRIKIASSHDAHGWEATDPVALVLDFQKLRRFLSEEMTRHQGEVRLGWTYEGHEQENGKTLVSLKQAASGKTQSIVGRVLVDATGTDREVLGRGEKDRHPAIVGRGVEFLLEVPAEVYRMHAGTLSFFIGQNWMPQGYAWIFPMAAHRLKVGVGRNFPDEQVVPHKQSFGFYLNRLIATCLQTQDYNILDRHGKTLTYTLRQRDRHFDENVLAIGDAVSTVNPLTFEGIRHAMHSGAVAAKHIAGYLEGQDRPFRKYRSEIRRRSGLRWLLSEALTKKIYREPKDEKVDLMLQALKAFSLAELKALVFDYRLVPVMKFALDYRVLVAKSAFRFSGKKRLEPMDLNKP
ncbi:MAG: NAD(P)/FAD-dependent oxidoreductase [bacterium]